MTDDSQIHASVTRLFADGDLSPGDFSESGKYSPGNDATHKIDDDLLKKLPPELYSPQFPDDVGLVRLNLPPALLHTLLERMRAEREIKELAASLGWVGQPTSEFSYTGRGGYARHFQDASIYWTESFGAKEVHGAIRNGTWGWGAKSHTSVIPRPTS
jgi:hypothetical protein